MKHIVKEINIFTGTVLNCEEFDNAADAMEYAGIMNELMEATPFQYKYFQI